MTSPGQNLRVERGDDITRQEFDKLDKRVKRIEKWVPIFLAVAIISTAIVTAILKVSLVLNGS